MGIVSLRTAQEHGKYFEEDQEEFQT